LKAAIHILLDRTGHYDALLSFSLLDREGDPGQMAMTALLIVFVLCPISHIFLWMLLGCCRRYVEDDVDQESGNKFVEMNPV
jgi:hypothetical protein